MRSPATIWVDGKLAAALPLPDRGLDFGDGVFETVLLWHGKPQFLTYHLARLETGLQKLSFPECRATAAEHLHMAASAFTDTPWAVMRLAVTRGSGPRGYAAPDQAVPRTIISAAPLQQDRKQAPSPIALAYAGITWASQPALAGIKHLNRLEQVLAANEARAAQVDDVVVLDGGGHVCSLSSANLFLVEEGRLVTPAITTTGIAGTRRRLVIEQLAPALGLTVVEETVAVSRLEQAAELFCCNSIRGLQPVARLGDTAWSEFPIALALHQQYCDTMTC
ncbi:aminodeoxychorismate lyase [Pseudohalioglobus sediminis]|uniref:Aminodeoxychorismate lyase n=1 Tax=Pseudohalioglobus sediminis TaxID=2606449 RepID=A0A5B0X4P2_9GAMM|nr:aminodeoxychorismate lyase [Pseudohalioglobus sediminis]KAA1193149.1 aminodeoxychorismate lyase [Pseudohalioglobus sediminis]